MNDESSFVSNEKSKLRRAKERGSFDRAAVAAALRSSKIAHVGMLREANGEMYPAVIPMLFGFDEELEFLYLHGSTGCGTAKSLGPVSVSVASLQAIVAAKSLFHHSANYTSAVVFGQATRVTDEAQVEAALKLITACTMGPERWADARAPNTAELTATSVIRVDIETASAKQRTGPPGEDAADEQLPYWSGLIPFETVQLPAVTADISAGIPVPTYFATESRQAQ